VAELWLQQGNAWSTYVQVMVDHALALPWDRYENYDMVVWGVRERVEEGEMEGAVTRHGAPYANILASSVLRSGWQTTVHQIKLKQDHRRNACSRVAATVTTET